MIMWKYVFACIVFILLFGVVVANDSIIIANLQEQLHEHARTIDLMQSELDRHSIRESYFSDILSMSVGTFFCIIGLIAIVVSGITFVRWSKVKKKVNKIIVNTKRGLQEQQNLLIQNTNKKQMELIESTKTELRKESQLLITTTKTEVQNLIYHINKNRRAFNISRFSIIADISFLSYTSFKAINDESIKESYWLIIMKNIKSLSSIIKDSSINTEIFDTFDDKNKKEIIESLDELKVVVDAFNFISQSSVSLLDLIHVETFHFENEGMTFFVENFENITFVVDNDLLQKKIIEAKKLESEIIKEYKRQRVQMQKNIVV